MTFRYDADRPPCSACGDIACEVPTALSTYARKPTMSNGKKLGFARIECGRRQDAARQEEARAWLESDEGQAAIRETFGIGKFEAKK